MGESEYAKRLAEVKETYEGNETTHEAEFVADLVGDFLYTDYDFVLHLANKKTDVFHHLWDEVKYLYKIATAGSKEARQLEKVNRNFERAYREASKSGAKVEGTKHSISETTDGRLVAVVDSDILNKIDTTSWDKVKKEAAKKPHQMHLRNSRTELLLRE